MSNFIMEVLQLLFFVVFVVFISSLLLSGLIVLARILGKFIRDFLGVDHG